MSPPVHRESSSGRFVAIPKPVTKEEEAPRIPAWLWWAIAAAPIMALWAVNAWAIRDYISHKSDQEKARSEQSLRDAAQDRDIKEFTKSIDRLQRITCAVARHQKVETAECQ